MIETFPNLEKDLSRLISSLEKYRGGYISKSSNPSTEHPVHFAVRMVERHFNCGLPFCYDSLNGIGCDEDKNRRPRRMWWELLAWCRNGKSLDAARKELKETGTLARGDSNHQEAMRFAKALQEWARYLLKRIEPAI